MALELNAKIREVLGRKVKSLRKKGIIPAVLYGEKTKSLPLEIDYKEFEKIFKEAGESTVIKLKIKDKKAQPTVGQPKADKNVLIYDIARDPVTDKFIHVDFYEVRMDKPITAEVPLVFEGESEAVKILEGVLVKNIIELEVEALPADLPHEIKVDISTLKTFDDLIRIKDLKAPGGVKILAEPDEVVASIVPPRSEEELKALEEKVEERVGEVAKAGEEEKVATEAVEGSRDEIGAREEKKRL